MNDSTPLVSVIMPVYNQERYVKDAVASVLGQTYRQFEFIIVDDGSTDRTAEILSRFRDERIRIIQKPNGGFISALLAGFQAARGEWIARMDSDDVSHPTRLAKQIDFLSAHPECAFVGTAYGLATPNDCFLERDNQFDWRFVEPAQITLSGRVFGDPTVMFHRETAASVGYYDGEFDNENSLWYRLLSLKKGAVLGESLYYYRWLMGSVSKSRFEHWAKVHYSIRIKYDPENAAKIESAEHDNLRALTKNIRKGVFIYLRAGDRNAALQLAWSGWKSYPLSAVRTKMLLYAILGIEGIRLDRVRSSAKGLVRCPPPLLPGDRLTSSRVKL